MGAVDVDLGNPITLLLIDDKLVEDGYKVFSPVLQDLNLLCNESCTIYTGIPNRLRSPGSAKDLIKPFQVFTISIFCLPWCSARHLAFYAVYSGLSHKQWKRRFSWQMISCSDEHDKSDAFQQVKPVSHHSHQTSHAVGESKYL